MSDVKETDWAYFAGIIDGEGCYFIGLYNTHSIKLAKGCPNYHTFIKISTTDKILTDWLKEKFNGTNNCLSRRTRVNRIERDIYSIQFGGKTLDYILPRIEPYILIKKPQHEVMKTMRTTFHENRRLQKTALVKEVHELRYQCYLKIRHLNSRYRNHPAKQDYSLRPCCPAVLSGEEFQVN